MSCLCSDKKYLGQKLGTELEFSSSNQLCLPLLTLHLLTTSVYSNLHLWAQTSEPRSALGHAGPEHRMGTTRL